MDPYPPEDTVANELAQSWFHPESGRSPYSGQTKALFPWTLAKAFLSSPAALALSSRQRRTKLETSVPEQAAELAALDSLDELNAKAINDSTGKQAALVQQLKEIGVGAKSPMRAVVFAERVATLRWLTDHLPKQLGLTPENVAMLHGGLSDVANGIWSSLPADFFIKAAGVFELKHGDKRRLPGIRNHPLKPRLALRTLRLNCRRLSAGRALEVPGICLARLRPRLGVESNRSRTPTSLLAGSFMIWRSLSEVFPRENLDSWYENLRSTFDWSARYWEQRSIMCRHVGSDDYLARAESYARRAVSLRPDTYSHTTLGTVLAARAASGEETMIVSYYEKMNHEFATAIDLDSTNPVTWLARLRHTIPIVRRVHEIPHSEHFPAGQIEQEWMTMYQSAASFGRSNEGVEKQLRSILEQFNECIR